MLSRADGRAAGERSGRPELADIFRQYGESYQQTHRLSASQQKVMRAISVCRTQELGGHLDRCDACGFERPGYNSCRNPDSMPQTLRFDPAVPQSPILSAKDLLLKLTGVDLSRCPCCHVGTMISVGDLLDSSSSPRWDSS